MKMIHTTMYNKSKHYYDIYTTMIQHNCNITETDTMVYHPETIVYCAYNNVILYYPEDDALTCGK